MTVFYAYKSSYLQGSDHGFAKNIPASLNGDTGTPLTICLNEQLYHKPCEWDCLFDYDSVNDVFISIGVGYMGEEESFEKEDQCRYRYEKFKDCDYKDKNDCQTF